MKNFNSKFLFFVICLGLLAIASPALADETRTVRVKVAAFDQILFNNDFTVHSCPDNAGSTNLTVNAWCAVEQLVSNQGWQATSTWFSFGIMLNSINQYDGSDGNYWLWFGNGEPGLTALNQHELANGENLLLAYGTGPLKLTTSASAPMINSTSTISAFYFDAMAWQWTPAASSTFVVHGQEIFDEDGVLDIWTSTSTPYNILVKKDGFLDSNSIIIIPQLPSLDIKLQIETASSTLLNENTTVQACETSPGSGVFSINGYCAIQQSGLASDWTWWSGIGAFLNSISSYENDYSNGIYWQWFSNSQYGPVALNSHNLESGENLLLTYGINPLRISAATTTPTINSTTTISVEEFGGFDASWNPVWSAAASSTFIVNGQEIFSANGSLNLFIATTSPYSVLGRKPSYIDSQTIILTGQAGENQTQNEPDQNNGGASEGSAGSSGASSVLANINIQNAINFLAANQNPDGSIGSSILYSDWAAIALSAAGESQAKTGLKNYLLGAGFNTDFGSRTADLERRAMALMSLGVNPYEGTQTDFIGRIVSAFDGTQIGDANIFNDDIFALFPLLKAGYSGSDEVVDKTLRFIISKQSANGSWDSVDLTAAAIQALTLAQKVGGLGAGLASQVDSALQAAKTFLRNSQDQNGGFGNNTISTAWAIQAINALGDSVPSWEKNGKNPLNFLASKQANDGGMEDADVNAGTRIWTTAFAIPAALGKTWEEILSGFSRPAVQTAPITNSQREINNSTTTPETATSTLTILPNENATSTPVSGLPEQSATSTAELNLPVGKNGIQEISAPQTMPAAKTKIISSSAADIAKPVENQKVLASSPDTSQISETSNLKAQISASLVVKNIHASQAAKTIFYASGGGTIILGLYLGWKFLVKFLF
jgi:hypothetical protein